MKKNQTEILELRLFQELKNSAEIFNNRIDHAEEKVRELM